MCDISFLFDYLIKEIPIICCVLLISIDFLASLLVQPLLMEGNLRLHQTNDCLTLFEDFQDQRQVNYSHSQDIPPNFKFKYLFL